MAPPCRAVLVAVACILLCIARVSAVKLKFKYEECLYYTFQQYEYFYGSYVSVPDVYGVAAKYDLVVTSPNGNKLYETLGESEATFHLVPTEAGTHKFCIRLNPERTQSRYVLAREVLWNINIGVGESHDKIQESDTQYLWHHVYQLDGQLQELKSTLHYLYWRERRHRQTVESTHKRVVYFAMLRSCFLVAVSIAQVVIVRRMFSK